jgi:membrane-associated phospholipid phosphatase
VRVNLMRTCKAALAWAVLFGVAVPAGADVVTEWNTVALTSIRATSMPPPRAARALAILHAAMYDAVNGIARTHDAYLVHSTVPASASMEAAASGAAHRVLVMLIPMRSTIFDAVHRQIVAGIRDSPQKASGLVWGRLVADSLLAARANDGSDDVVPAPVTSAHGSWEPTPAGFAPYLLPQWGFVTPFALPNIVDVRPPGPPALDSDRWSADYNEAKALGAAAGSTRTGDQTQIALFWADGAGTVTPPGHWNQIAQQVGAALGNTLHENARLFALLNLAMADAAICAWDAKYAFNFWRPVTAIRYGDGDGNPNTEADRTWRSLIATPPFPDYVSGHSAFSGGAATVLARFYGTDNVAFVTGSDATPGVYRSYASFSAAAAEAAVSRLYGGIHFRSANDDGRRSGMAIGEYVFRNYLQPKSNRSRSKAREQLN